MSAIGGSGRTVNGTIVVAKYAASPREGIVGAVSEIGTDGRVGMILGVEFKDAAGNAACRYSI